MKLKFIILTIISILFFQTTANASFEDVINTEIDEAISAMMTKAAPGRSHYSRIALEHCDEECQLTPLCESVHDTLSCKPPKLDEWTYKKKIASYSEEDLGTEKYEALLKKARESSFTIYESYDQGLLRYATIARASYEVSREFSLRAIDKEVYSNCAKANKFWWDDDCKALKAARPWRWKTKELMYALLAIAHHESGYRYDIHTGTGQFGRGDRKKINGVWVYQSICLAQIKYVADKRGQRKTIEGRTIDDLLGIDLESTKNCFRTSATYLTMRRGMCSRRGAMRNYNYDHWAEAMFTAYGTGSSCQTYKTDKDGFLIKDKNGDKIHAPHFLLREYTLHSMMNRGRPMRAEARLRLEKMMFEEKPEFVPAWMTQKTAQLSSVKPTDVVR